MKNLLLLALASLAGTTAAAEEDAAGRLKPWLARPAGALIAEDFTPGGINDRWFFTEWWTAREGVLLRNELAGENKRLFWKKPTYKDSSISLDFSFRGAEEIRLMSGTPGKYNFVVRLHRDHFRLNTAGDSTAGHLPSIQGECPFRFEEQKWYRLQVEVLADEIVARIDDDHFVVGRHPIIDRQRSYFALQVNGPGAAFDNIRLYNATPVEGWQQRRPELLQAQLKRPWLPRSLKERHKDRKVIARDQAWRTDPEYRELVKRYELLRKQAREKFPAAHVSTKEAQKKIGALRKELLKKDAKYKELSRSINKARRSEELYLRKKSPHLETLPAHQYKAALKKSRLQAMENDPAFNRLLEKTATLEKKGQAAYPQLESSNEEIVAGRKAAGKKLQETSEEFRSSNGKTASAWRAVQAHLLKSDPILNQLEKELQRAKKGSK